MARVVGELIEMDLGDRIWENKTGGNRHDAVNLVREKKKKNMLKNVKILTVFAKNHPVFWIPRPQKPISPKNLWDDV